MKITKSLRHSLFALAACAALVPAARAQDAAMMDDSKMAESGMMGNMMSMTPMAISGAVVRQYVDTMGNISSVDVQTAGGVQQVRFSPAIAATDARFAGLGKGSMINETGVVTPGIVSYSPDGSMISGLLMQGGTMGGAMAAAPTTMMGMAMMPARTLDLSAVASPPSQYGALVALPGGRFTVIRSMNGMMYYVDPDNGKMTEVTADNMMMPKGMKMKQGTRVMTLSPDGMMVTGTMGGDTMNNGSMSGDMSGGTGAAGGTATGGATTGTGAM